MNKTGKEILNTILEHLKTTTNEFATSLGMERSQALYDIQNGKTKSISANLSNKIVAAYPQFNLSWLLTGVGNMFNESIKDRLLRFLKQNNISIDDFAASINVAPSYIYSLREDIKPNELEGIMSRYPNLNINWLLSGEGDMLKVNNVSSNVLTEPNAEYQKSESIFEQFQKLKEENIKLLGEIKDRDEKIIGLQNELIAILQNKK